MLKIIIASLLVLGLAGCGSNSTVDQHYTNRDTINHPTWPKPIEGREVKTKVLNVDGEVYVARTYEDDITYQQYQEDIYRWAKDMKATLCFYRTALKEPQCADLLVKPQSGAKSQ